MPRTFFLIKEIVFMFSRILIIWVFEGDFKTRLVSEQEQFYCKAYYELDMKAKNNKEHCKLIILVVWMWNSVFEID
jgi:hypothetical protein